MDIKFAINLSNEAVEALKTEYKIKDDKDLCRVIEILLLSEIDSNHVKLIKVEV